MLVKANAYGHGAVEFASLMESAGADYLAVAYPVEGVELRNAGIKSPIMVLTAGTDFFEEIIDSSLEPGIPNLSALKALCQVLEKRGVSDFPVHIKLDTGMHRLVATLELNNEELERNLAEATTRVEYVSQTLERSNHFTRNEGADRHIEFFAKRRPNRRCGLYNDVFALAHSFVDFVDFGNLHQCARRAYAYALTAKDTGGVREASVFRRSNNRVKPAFFKAENAQAVRVFTSFHASTAEDTFGGVSNDRGGKTVEGCRGLFALIHIIARARDFCYV